MRLINTLKSIEENKMCWNVTIIDTKYSIPPRSRSGATLTTIRNKAYLIGGVSNHLHDEVFEYDFVTETWKLVEHLNEHNLYKTRFAHSATLYQNSIFVYGGEEGYNAMHKKRSLFNDINEFNTITDWWGEVHSSDFIFSRRKHHASWCVGSTLVVHGGLDPSGYSIDEFFTFNLLNHSSCELKWFPNRLGNLCGHTFVSILNDSKTQFPKFEEYDEDIDYSKLAKINLAANSNFSQANPKDGIYCFGGKTKFW